MFVSSLSVSVMQTFIVYLGSASENGYRLSVDTEAVTSSHLEILSFFLQSNPKAVNAILYSYNKVFSGFAALLLEEEARERQKHPDVMYIFESQLTKINTTRSWEFLGLGLNNGVISDYSTWKKAKLGEDTIIAHLDTGVWPESRSFTDEDIWVQFLRNTMVPVKMKTIPLFTVSIRKLIGARYFYKGFAESLRWKFNMTFSYMKIPRDSDGHGSHTLSTAGGNLVPGVDVKKFGKGKAAGGSPRTCVAAYKVYWLSPSDQMGGCSESDILAALEAAIADGVDVISLSLGGGPEEYLSDSVAIGSSYTVKNGVPVVASAGNSGPDHYRTRE